MEKLPRSSIKRFRSEKKNLHRMVVINRKKTAEALFTGKIVVYMTTALLDE